MRELAQVIPELTEIATIDNADPSAVRLGGLRMEGFLRQLSATADPAEYLDQETITRLQDLYREFETGLEFEFAIKLLEGRVSLKDYPLYRRFKRLTKKEIDLASISDLDRVLFIGSGPFPISAILMAEKTGVQIDCIDSDPDAVEKSRHVLEKTGLEEQVKVFLDDGISGNTINYPVIIIALLAQPKERILGNIWRHAPQDARVICRTSEGTRSIFYKGISRGEMQESDHFAVVAKRYADFDDTITPFLLKVKREPDIR